MRCEFEGPKVRLGMAMVAVALLATMLVGSGCPTAPVVPPPEEVTTPPPRNLEVVDGLFECGNPNSQSDVATFDWTEAGDLRVLDPRVAEGCCPEGVISAVLYEDTSLVSVTYAIGDDACGCTCWLNAYFTVLDPPERPFELSLPDEGPRLIE